MSEPGAPRPRNAPRWPTRMLAGMAILAAVSLAQGVVDIVVPALTGEEPFQHLVRATALWGPGFLSAYVFVHNVGLACVVPGFGFVASRFERRTENRAVIGWILAGAVVASLAIGLEYLFQAAPRFDLTRALPLFALEALGVLLLALPAAREMRGFVPTPVYAWSLVTPFRRLRTPFVASLCVLAAASFVEAFVVFPA